MALIERIMGAPFEPDQAQCIAVHQFAAWCYESAFGPRTVAEIKQYYGMSSADAAEFDAIIAKITGTDATRHRLVFQLEQIFMLAEMRCPFYDTPTLVRSRLGL